MTLNAKIPSITATRTTLNLVAQEETCGLIAVSALILVMLCMNVAPSASEL